ncbi:MiaB/RimO family radical SAM methylthiotransferase [Formicincola oecophyllae]|uniref:MiaB/RimO family radical SAM methylthiotransferase n=1 Tax=Formicincola oecophyllae TaxID=2558361 RepID=A0A4Y6UAY8_9PROT|nr:MiaB/RimO family radical SAM methylthiotransferase [Formicincola oecophyllae]QDH13626.1 MiaB/RimO family radical SAM methylthiotransferase [Formicincola oecophyllae]
MTERTESPIPPTLSEGTDGSISLITFGCRLNAHESDAMAHYASQAQRQKGDEVQGKQTIIVNTCAVTGEAERQARQAVRRAHREHPQARIIITGCASERDKQRWMAMAGVDQVLDNATKATPAAWGLAESATTDAPPSRYTRALLQIQQGCDHDCTFCVIPQGRGRAHSITPDVILRRARALTEAGHEEIVLTGVDIASWKGGEGGQAITGLGSLCRHLLDAVPAIKRLRLSSLDPALLQSSRLAMAGAPQQVDGALWDLIAGEERFMPHLHLSLQAGSDLILKRMKRRHLVEDALALVNRARALRPGMGFGADLIAGFPTETEELFAETLAFVQESQLPFLHVFPYSPRPGTAAARIQPLPRNVRQERAARLRQAGAANRAVFLANLVGQTCPVLMETPTTGHTPEFAPIAVPATTQLQPGQTIMLHVTSSDGEKLQGAPA